MKIVGKIELPEEAKGCSKEVLEATKTKREVLSSAYGTLTLLHKLVSNTLSSLIESDAKKAVHYQNSCKRTEVTLSEVSALLGVRFSQKSTKAKLERLDSDYTEMTSKVVNQFTAAARWLICTAANNCDYNAKSVLESLHGKLGETSNVPSEMSRLILLYPLVNKVRRSRLNVYATADKLRNIISLFEYAALYNREDKPELADRYEEKVGEAKRVAEKSKSEFEPEAINQHVLYDLQTENMVLVERMNREMKSMVEFLIEGLYKSNDSAYQITMNRIREKNVIPEVYKEFNDEAIWLEILREEEKTRMNTDDDSMPTKEDVEPVVKEFPEQKVSRLRKIGRFLSFVARNPKLSWVLNFNVI